MIDSCMRYIATAAMVPAMVPVMMSSSLLIRSVILNPATIDSLLMAVLKFSREGLAE